MDIEGNTKKLAKLEKKRKWDEAATLAADIGDYYIENNDYSEGLTYLEKAIEMRQQEKKAEPVIILYRKIINSARKGKNKTNRELFRYAAAAIPLVEEYITVLKENNNYLTKHGALTRYFLGECREIVSGISQRNIEFLQAGKVFVEVGINLSKIPGSEEEAEESFQKSRVIFDMMQNREELFNSLLAEAELNIRNHKLEKGFALFDEARTIFEDETQILKAVNIEKVAYAEIGIQFLRDHYQDQEKRKLADLLIAKAREAHLNAKSLGEVSTILFEISKIHLNHQQLEMGFKSIDEAISNSQLVGDEAVPRAIIEYLFNEGKKESAKVLSSPSKISVDNIDSLLMMKFFNKIEEIERKLDRGAEIEEVALFIWKFGINLRETKVIADDFPFTQKSLEILINNRRMSAISQIGEYLEQKIEKLAEKRERKALEQLKTFLVDRYSQVDEYQAAAWLNLKIAAHYATWGNYEEQLNCLQEGANLIQSADIEIKKAYGEALLAQFTKLEIMVPETIRMEFLTLLGNIYLQLQDSDRYDSLYATYALKALEEGNYNQAIAFHQKDFDFLVQTKNTTRGMARIEEFASALHSHGKFEEAVLFRGKQTKLLIEGEAPQEQVLQVIKRLEDQISEALAKNIKEDLINDLFNNILKLYDYLGVKEAQGDAAFDLSNRLIEAGYIKKGISYLKQAFEIFMQENLLEKIGILLDYVTSKNAVYENLDDQKIADSFTNFLSKCLVDLGQPKDAAKLKITRAVSLIGKDDKKASIQFSEAKELISKTGSEGDMIQFYQDYGTALLKVGRIDEGMEKLAKAESSASTNSLAIADTCLTVAKNRFTEKDYDTYFTLIDRALSIYTGLEMYRESSLIALSEARKLWSVENLAYTMIYLERSWAPVTLVYNENVSQMSQPIITFAEEVIESLFSKNEAKSYDEAKNFLEFLGRIYQHLNLTEKILDVERKKIDALIGRGNIEGALSQVLDMATLGIDNNKFSETLALLRDLVPIFVRKNPAKSKFILRMYINLLIDDISALKQSLDFYVTLLIDSIKLKQRELFQDQVSLFFVSLSEIPEAEEVFVFFTIRLTQELSLIKEFNLLFTVLIENITNLKSLKLENGLKLVNLVSSLMEQYDLQRTEVLQGLSIIRNLSKDLDDQSVDFISALLLKISTHYKNQKEIYDQAIEFAFQISEMSSNPSPSLNLLYGLTQDDLEAENYLNALRRLDEVIDKLKATSDPEGIARKYLRLLDHHLELLAKRKKKKWMDLVTSKYQIINERFLGMKDQITPAEENLIDDQIDEMLDFMDKKK
ncbi:MAG: hypothetical protein EAX86_10705 [Candidatus Heimdallarchaeota archaeon]|nr:hypothetical protein [Candidatus Heimdallarchaeota archaeon]